MIVLALLWRAFVGPRSGCFGGVGVPVSLDQGVEQGKRRGWILCIDLFCLGLGWPLGLERGRKRSDTDDFGADLGMIPVGRVGVLSPSVQNFFHRCKCLI